MCLPDFVEFKDIKEDNPLIGYRTWRNTIKSLNLKSENQDYIWTSPIDGPHEVLNKNSGLYAYNYNYNNNNYNYIYNYYYYNYNNNLSGIILQYGKAAIHKDGQRSEYAKIKTLFTIRESDAKGPDKFLVWIRDFNNHIKEIAEKYQCDTMHWQDFLESQK